MSLWMAFTIGLSEIRAHAFRSALSMLGIVLGTGSLIATMALTRGIEVGTRIFMQQMGGLELVTVAVKEPSAVKADFANLSPGRTLRDAEAIRASATLVSHVSPELTAYANASSDAGESERFQVRGIVPDHFVIGIHSLAAGRFLTDLDVESGAHCVVVGHAVAKSLWPGESPSAVLGRNLSLDGVPFQVVGVLSLYEREEQSKARRSGHRFRSSRWDPFRSKNESILIPLTTLFYDFRSGKNPLDALETVKLDALTLRVADLDRFRGALDQVRTVLDTTHRGIDDFELETREDWFDRVEASVRAARLSGGLISAISLVVGAIGIMNIMLASISERVREIGIRLAVGARRRDIFLQILTESALTSLIGGGLGILASLGLIELLKLVGPNENAPVLTWDAIVFSVAFAVAAGLLSGLYPAWKASRLDPISALRYE